MISNFRLISYKNQYRRSMIFLLCVLFSLGNIIDANTLQFKSTTAPTVPTTEKSDELFKDQVCNTTECVRSATDIRSAMNASVDPCDDFYHFTCGRWSTEHQIQKGYTESSAVTVAKQKLLNDVLKVLKSNGTADEPTALRKSRNLFRSCMDQETRDSLKYDTVFKYLTQMGLPAVPRFFNLTDSDENIKYYKFDWKKTDIAFNSLLRVSLLVNCEVGPNIFNASQNIIQCKTPKYKFKFNSVELALDEADRLMDVEIFARNQTDLQEAWHKLSNFSITTLIKEKYDLPADFHERLNAAMEVINKTESIISYVKHFSKNVGLSYSSLEPIDELQYSTNEYLIRNKIKSKLIWEQYLEELFSYSNLTLDLNNNDEIFLNVKDIYYYKGVAALVTKKSDVELELWAWWRAVLNLIIHTTSDASEYVENILNVFNINNELPRELVCARLTNYRMDFALTYALTDKLFLNTTQSNIKDIWYNINEAFEMRVNSLTWMDEKTKNLTIQKSKAMIDFIGYPEWLLNKTVLEKFYSSLPDNSDTYMDNLIEINKFKTKCELEQLLYLVNNKEWPVNVNLMAINAFYSTFKNIIAIPFAIINYLFYNRGHEALNYGSMGSVLGHELTHGFDNKGSNFDKYGNYRTWWSSTTSKDFSNMTGCFVEQYDKFYVPEVDAYINGTLTLGENLADNGGLHHAYIAYQNYKKKNGEEFKLPGLEKFTNDQLFFLSYGHFWCSERNTEGPKHSMVDPHCPDKYRVLGNLMNSEEFAKAFNCPLGSKMNPRESKCKIW